MGMNENTLRPRGKVGNIVAAEEAVAKRMMRIPIINDLQAIAAATHAAVKAVNIAAEAAGEIVVTTMMITIKDRHVVGAEVLNMAKVVDGTAMKIGIHAQPERAGVIVINI